MVCVELLATHKVMYIPDIFRNSEYLFAFVEYKIQSTLYNSSYRSFFSSC